MSSTGVTTAPDPIVTSSESAVPNRHASVVGSGLRKQFGRGDAAVVALAGVDITVPAGQFTAVMGPSGSGKSTLLHVLAGLDAPDEGTVTVAGRPVTGRREAELTRLRRDHMGFVFQQFNLLPTLTAQENILLPLRLAGRRPDLAWWDLVVRTVGLESRLRHKPAELSGGQQQRVAVARALVTRPDVVFADEPTGNLDSRAGAEVLGLLRSSVDEHGQTVVMVTHDPGAATFADRVVFLADGRVVADVPHPTREQVLDHLARATEV